MKKVILDSIIYMLITFFVIIFIYVSGFYIQIGFNLGNHRLEISFGRVPENNPSIIYVVPHNEKKRNNLIL